MSSGGPSGYVKGFNGAIAGSEPRAVLVARDILGKGGSAADAAVAAYFTMAVTLPSAASLGSGGACLILDHAKKSVESLDFTQPAGRPVPLAPRGMFALHAKYGKLPWTQLVSPAETMARFGGGVSRAFARDLAAAAPKVMADSSARAIFGEADGTTVDADARIRQPDLASTLSVLRRSPAAFYDGSFATRVAAAYRGAGIDLTAGDLRGAAPEFRPAITVDRYNQTADFAATPAGLVAAQMWAILYRDGAWGDADTSERPHLLAEVSRRTYADVGRAFHATSGVLPGAEGLVSERRTGRLMAGYREDAKGPIVIPGGGAPGPAPVDQQSASIVAADVNGQAVACAFSMNGNMGTGRVAPGTGIVIAAPPDPAGRGWPAMALMLLRYGTQYQLEFMGAATGGPVAPVALVDTALGVMVDGKTAEDALARPRYYNPANPDHTVVEQRPGAATIAERLRKRGGTVVEGGSSLGRLNVFVCPAGFAGADSACAIRTDRRGLGLAERD